MSTSSSVWVGVVVVLVLAFTLMILGRADRRARNWRSPYQLGTVLLGVGVALMLAAPGPLAPQRVGAAFLLAFGYLLTDIAAIRFAPDADLGSWRIVGQIWRSRPGRSLYVTGLALALVALVLLIRLEQ